MHVVYITIYNMQCQALLGFMNIDIPISLMAYFEKLYRFYFFQIFNNMENEDITDTLINPNYSIIGFNIKAGKNLVSPFVVSLLLCIVFGGVLVFK